MNKETLGINTICTHVGEIEDKQFKGAISPLYMSTSYAYEGVDVKRYPRYFNTPNQEMLCKKVAALERAEDALIFGSGMAAISTTLLAFLKAGDHIVLQKSLYGGTYNFIVEEFDKFDISYTFTDGLEKSAFENAIQPNTKAIYVETPSNPLMTITDLRMVATLAKSKGIISMVDNTFATPINQNPVMQGFDIVLHSATKYMGGHSDISAGAVMGSQEHIKIIWNKAKNLGGNLSDFSVWLLERSLKTMALRVKKQSRNAKKLAKWLYKDDRIQNVYYPGLKSHPNHDLAKLQMRGYGGMLSFEIAKGYDAKEFLDNLQLIKPSMSLAGVESTILFPKETSHALLSAEERKNQGIIDTLLRFSVGIEDKQDLIFDIDSALKASRIKK